MIASSLGKVAQGCLRLAAAVQQMHVRALQGDADGLCDEVAGERDGITALKASILRAEAHMVALQTRYRQKIDQRTEAVSIRDVIRTTLRRQ